MPVGGAVVRRVGAATLARSLPAARRAAGGAAGVVVLIRIVPAGLHLARSLPTSRSGRFAAAPNGMVKPFPQSPDPQTKEIDVEVRGEARAMFAAILLLIAGVLNVIYGIAAISNGDFFKTRPRTSSSASASGAG